MLCCSFYNWETQTSTSNPTPNYQVIAENASGLLFKNKRDRKILNVDPKVCSIPTYLETNSVSRINHKKYTPSLQAQTPGDNSTRTPIETDQYIQIVIYDHITRRKT